MSSLGGTRARLLGSSLKKAAAPPGSSSDGGSTGEIGVRLGSSPTGGWVLVDGAGGPEGSCMGVWENGCDDWRGEQTADRGKSGGVPASSTFAFCLGRGWASGAAAAGVGEDTARRVGRAEGPRVFLDCEATWVGLGAGGCQVLSKVEVCTG